MLQRQLPRIQAVEREAARKQFMVDERQAVLVAACANHALQGFRRSVPGRRRDDALALARVTRRFLQAAHKAEVADLDVIAHEEQIARLDVEMLKAVFDVEPIEDLGRFAEIGE